MGNTNTPILEEKLAELSVQAQCIVILVVESPGEHNKYNLIRELKSLDSDVSVDSAKKAFDEARESGLIAPEKIASEPDNRLEHYDVGPYYPSQLCFKE